jgi:hypothetical protein
MPFQYEAVTKGHNTRGILPHTVAPVPITILDIVPNQCLLPCGNSLFLSSDFVLLASMPYLGLTSSTRVYTGCHLLHAAE